MQGKGWETPHSLGVFLPFSPQNEQQHPPIEKSSWKMRARNQPPCQPMPNTPREINYRTESAQSLQHGHQCGAYPSLSHTATTPTGDRSLGLGTGVGGTTPVRETGWMEQALRWGLIKWHLRRFQRCYGSQQAVKIQKGGASWNRGHSTAPPWHPLLRMPSLDATLKGKSCSKRGEKIHPISGGFQDARHRQDGHNVPAWQSHWRREINMETVYALQHDRSQGNTWHKKQLEDSSNTGTLQLEHPSHSIAALQCHPPRCPGIPETFNSAKGFCSCVIHILKGGGV